MPLTPHVRRSWKSKGFGSASELRDSKVVRETVRLAEAISKAGGFGAIVGKSGGRSSQALEAFAQQFFRHKQS